MAVSNNQIHQIASVAVSLVSRIRPHVDPLPVRIGSTVDGRQVRCLTPEVQVLCHVGGYEPDEDDFRDMAALQQRFDVELPEKLTR